MVHRNKQDLPLQQSRPQQLQKVLLHQLLPRLQLWEQEVTSVLSCHILFCRQLAQRCNKNATKSGVIAALGAVAVAAVGVWGVFKMAMAVAEGTGRTLNSNPGGSAVSAVASDQESEASGLLPMQPAVPSGPVYPPSPQHRKVPVAHCMSGLLCCCCC